MTEKISPDKYWEGFEEYPPERLAYIAHIALTEFMDSTTELSITEKITFRKTLEALQILVKTKDTL